MKDKLAAFMKCSKEEEEEVSVLVCQILNKWCAVAVEISDNITMLLYRI